MERLALSRLAALVATDAPTGRPLSSADTFATVYAGDVPAVTVSRPYLGRGLFTVSAVDGSTVATFATSPTFAAIVREIRAYVRAGAGLADMTAAELAAEETDARAREIANRETAESATFATFKASATCRAIRAARRAELAADMAAPAVDVAEVRTAAMRASVPALRAAGRSLARQMETATGRNADALAIRARVVADVAELKAGAIPGELAAAFALNVRPAEYRAPMTPGAQRLAAELAARPGDCPAELAADMAPDAREVVATRQPGGRWTLARAGVAAGFAALAFASPASAEIAAGHFHAAPGTLDSYVETARAFALAYPVAAYAGGVAALMALCTWANR